MASEPAPVGPVGDTAIIATARGLELIGLENGRSTLLWAGGVTLCKMDRAARVVWFIRPDGDSNTLSFLDLDDGGKTGPVDVAKSLPRRSLELWIAYNSTGSTGYGDDYGVVVGVQSEPWLSYDRPFDDDDYDDDYDDDDYDDDDDDDKPPKRTVEQPEEPEEELDEDEAEWRAEEAAWRAENKAVRAALDAATAKLFGREQLVALALRASASGPRSQPEGLSPRPKVMATPDTGCRQVKRDCGRAKGIPNAALWLVTVGNEHGDFWHELVEFFDPKSGMFIDPTDPTRRSPTPTSDGVDLSSANLTIPASGAGYALGSKLVHFERGVVFDDEHAKFCGWREPAKHVTTLADDYD